MNLVHYRAGFSQHIDLMSKIIIQDGRKRQCTFPRKAWERGNMGTWKSMKTRESVGTREALPNKRIWALAKHLHDQPGYLF